MSLKSVTAFQTFIAGAVIWSYHGYSKQYRKEMTISEWKIMRLFCLETMRSPTAGFFNICQSFVPGKVVNNAQAKLNTCYLKGYQLEELRDFRHSAVKKLVKNAASLKKDLSKTGRGKNPEVDDLVQNVQSLAKHFKELDKKTREELKQARGLNENFVLVCTQIVQHVPFVVNVMDILQPILMAYSKAKKRDKLIAQTSKRITAIMNEFASLISKVEKAGIAFTASETDEILLLLNAIIDGFDIVAKTMEERRTLVWPYFSFDHQRNRLEGWLRVTQQMLEENQRNQVSMVHYRTRCIMETQRSYFPALASMSLGNTVIGVGLLYLVVDIRRISSAILEADPFIIKCMKASAKTGRVLVGQILKFESIGNIFSTFGKLEK